MFTEIFPLFRLRGPKDEKNFSLQHALLGEEGQD